MRMNRMMLVAVLGLAVGIPMLSGCFSNGAANYDPKCSSFSEVSVVKTYYIEQIEVDGYPSLFSALTNSRQGKTEGKTFIFDTPHLLARLGGREGARPPCG